MNNPKTEDFAEKLRELAFRALLRTETQTMLIDAADRLEALEAELSRLKAQQRWIPVTERLPDEGITVLTFDKRGHVRDRALYTFRGGQRLFRPDGLAPGYDVLYWMPLQKPPKEENHDKDIEPELVERVTHKPDAQLRPLRDMDEIKYYMGEEPEE